MKLTSKRNIKNLIRSNALFGRTVGTSLLLMLASCSAIDTVVEPEETNGEQNENMATVTFLIPDGEDSGDTWGTRAGYDTSKETALSNLYAVAVNTATNEATVFTLMNGFNAGNGYRGYYITLERGNTYKFYVFGNILRYMNDNSTSQHPLSEYIKTQSDIDNLVLTFSRSQPLEPGHLPMACLYDKLKITVNNKDQSNNNNGITVGQDTQSIKIQADMTYLCSKVRYTILFNNEEGQISEAFGKEKFAIRFNVDDDAYPVAFNIRKYIHITDPTKVITQKDKITGSNSESPYLLTPKELGLEEGYINMDMSYWRLNLSRYEWPTNGANYPASPNDPNLTEWTGTNVDTEWKTKHARAWQGVVYLPENDNAGVEHTGLDFPFVIDKWDGTKYDGGKFTRDLYKEIILFGDNDNEQHYSGTSSDYGDSGDYNTDSEGKVTGTSHGLVRGMMYDVVAMVKTPDVIEIKVYARTKPWDYSQVPETW